MLKPTLESLLPAERQPAGPALADEPPADDTTEADARSPSSQERSEDGSTTQSNADQSTTTVSSASVTTLLSSESESPPPTVEGLELEHQERTFIPLLASLIPTPRGAKKLANLYRLLRISVDEEEADNFVGTPEGGGPFQAAAILLAVLICAPGEAQTSSGH